MRHVIAHDHRDKCPSRKIRYRDEHSANEHIRLAHQISTNEKLPVRSYYHSVCHGWHLTSQQQGANDGAPDDFAARKRRAARKVWRKRKAQGGLQDDGMGQRGDMPRLSRRVIDD